MMRVTAEIREGGNAHPGWGSPLLPSSGHSRSQGEGNLTIRYVSSSR
jgi:hypothetical protein